MDFSVNLQINLHEATGSFHCILCSCSPLLLSDTCGCFSVCMGLFVKAGHKSGAEDNYTQALTQDWQNNGSERHKKRRLTVIKFDVAYILSSRHLYSLTCLKYTFTYHSSINQLSHAGNFQLQPSKTIFHSYIHTAFMTKTLIAKTCFSPNKDSSTCSPSHLLSLVPRSWPAIATYWPICFFMDIFSKQRMILD